jgi:hypothetical protein
MFKNVLLILTAVFLISCATITSKKEYDINFYSKEQNSQVMVNEQVYDLPAKIKVKRSKNDLLVTYLSEADSSKALLKPSVTYKFIYGNLVWGSLLPAAYLIDLTNQKRFYYGKYIHLYTTDSTRIVTTPITKRYQNSASRYNKALAKQLNVFASFPWVNDFYMQPEGEGIKTNTGFMGFGLGVDYFYKSNKYISCSIKGVMDFFIPVPVAVDPIGELEFMSSSYIMVTDNIFLEKFSLGYGINAAHNDWRYRYFENFGAPPAPRKPVVKDGKSFGLVVNGYYQLTENFWFGLIYRPNFLKFEPALELEYEHVISLD